MSDASALVKPRKFGGSLVVTLPKDIVKANKIREGEIVEITVRKVQIDGFGALRGIGPFTHDDELKPHE